jgi:hypothetical protein
MIVRTKLLPRTEHVRDAWLCVIVTEGEKTEPQYFDGLQRLDIIPRSRVKVEVIPPDPEKHDSSPNHVCSRADAFMTSYELSPGIDQLWLVLDVDRWGGNHLAATVHHAECRQYRLAISNPGFETWLLLHHTDDLTGIATSAHCEQRLRNTLGSYNKSSLDLTRFPPDTIRTAMTRARQVTPDLRGWPQKPGTQVYALLETLLPTSAS